MKKLSNYLLVYLITVQLCFRCGQTKTTDNGLSDPLGMDQAIIVLRNKNCPDPISFMYNLVVCEQCDFERLSDPVPMDSNETLSIDTRFPYDFQLFSGTKNATIQCHIESYRFSEHGTYLFEVRQIHPNVTSCTITQTQESSYYWTPIIIVILLLLLLVFLIQLFRFIQRKQYFNRILTNRNYQELVGNQPSPAPRPSLFAHRLSLPVIPEETHTNDVHPVINTTNDSPLIGSTRLSDNSVKITKGLPKRLQSLDTFRGFSLMVMIFVNYGGGGYWFFDHSGNKIFSAHDKTPLESSFSVWNGLTLADLVFPWFVWMMGVSIVLSQRSLLKKKVSKLNILLKICRRTVILFLLGLILQGGYGKPKNLRILGVLQRLALCYFFTAVIILIFDEEDQSHSSTWPIGDDVYQPISQELRNTVFQFWPEWICVTGIVIAWIMITFTPKIDGCPRGYIGPGGKHMHGMYRNCTGGMAGYFDRLILGSAHLYGYPTCREIYHTEIPYDPEGILGVFTGIFLCYLGAHAGHCFAYSTRVFRTCTLWVTSGLICGFFGLLLSKGGQSESWIPINKNLWSLSFIFVLAGLAFIILTVLYLLVDVKQWFTGEPWLWLGMNSIVLYVGHEICSRGFPIQFQVDNTHKELLAVHAYGVLCWIIIAGILYYKKIFIAI
ncbi:unnamed protein product [Adineta ricciae]|uniref:DUF5009 domain-containing protein n=1 Tax=Adineta ricciae TaxID=249248 RepID=A0A813YIG3_ADIRI|nr:unnamed protein product [Adineta ricciae]